MEAWLIGLITFVCTTVLGYILGEAWGALKKRTAKYKKYEKQEKQAQIREVVEEVLNAKLEEFSKRVNKKFDYTDGKLDKLDEKVTKVETDLGSVKAGTQASLRDDLYRIFNDCNTKGFATIDERENFENLYDKYHHLGANGVMDNLKSKFEDLPLEPTKKSK